MSRKYLEADRDGSHDWERVVVAASGGTLSEDSHGEQEGAAGTFGGGGDRLPSSTQESTGRPPARDATPPSNLSSSDLGPQICDLRGCSQRFEPSLIICRSPVSPVPMYPGVHQSSASKGCNLCSKAVQLGRCCLQHLELPLKEDSGKILQIHPGDHHQAKRQQGFCAPISTLDM